jgi:hypothetical protein
MSTQAIAYANVILVTADPFSMIETTCGTFLSRKKDVILVRQMS